MAGKNKKMTDWVKKMDTPGKSKNEATEVVEPQTWSERMPLKSTACGECLWPGRN